ncbi:Scr1 family TA system antitoxin-like transcriptional regulator [Streptomyces sp. NPDC004609]|uniref:helix-turn-helix domain-containing protein n=1 Tax=Streptomyces sp. NPDC004609 TaxID=3364704 RepID=UPI00367B1FFD
MPGQREGDGTAAKAVSDPRREFAEALRDARELRLAGKWTQAQLAREVRTSSSTISRIEGSDFPIPSNLPEIFDQIFETDGRFKDLYERIREQGYVAHAQRRMKLETTAVAIAEWSQTVVPGLLQTPSYARALFRAGKPRAANDEIKALVRARMERQELFQRKSPPDFSAVVCESVIRRNVGGADVMREQLAVLLSHGKRPTSVVQVLPLGASCHALMDAPVSILTTASGTVVVHTEGIRSGSMIEEPGDVRHLSRSYDVVTASALSPDASAELILKVMEAL